MRKKREEKLLLFALHKLQLRFLFLFILNLFFFFCSISIIIYCLFFSLRWSADICPRVCRLFFSLSLFILSQFLSIEIVIKRNKFRLSCRRQKPLEKIDFVLFLFSLFCINFPNSSCRLKLIFVASFRLF